MGDMSCLQEELSAKYVLVVTHPLLMKVPVLNFMVALFIALRRIRPELHWDKQPLLIQGQRNRRQVEFCVLSYPNGISESHSL